MEGNRINNINCFQCVYFSITWDPKFPKACKLFGFKSAGLPSITVFQSTGKDCIAFKKKEVKKINSDVQKSKDDKYL